MWIHRTTQCVANSRSAFWNFVKSLFQTSFIHSWLNESMDMGPTDEEPTDIEGPWNKKEVIVSATEKRN